MRTKSLVIAVLCIFASLSNAAHLFNLSNKPISINRCPIIQTDNPFDLALLNDGYFVVSEGKKDSERFFTRYGKFLLNKDYYLVTEYGDYLLGLRKNADPKHLHRIKIPSKHLPPKATSHVEMGLNLPANIQPDDYRIISSSIYDSISNAHVLHVKFNNKKHQQWEVSVSVNEIELGHGILVFDNSGTLVKQEGFEHLQWPTDYGLNDLSIQFVDTTQYAAPFEVNLVHSDGYRLGTLISAAVSADGDIFLLYDNGESKPLKNRIAVAKFLNPGYLELVSKTLYKPTEKSGTPRLHWLNSKGSVASAALEPVTCLIQ